MSDLRDTSEESLEARLREIEDSIPKTLDRGERSSLHYEKGRINKELRIRST